MKDDQPQPGASHAENPGAGPRSHASSVNVTDDTGALRAMRSVSRAEHVCIRINGMTAPDHPVLAGDIPPGRGLAVDSEAGAVALFCVGDTIHALDDACLHCGSSLAQGTLQGTEVACPGCAWRYDVITGCVRGVRNLRVETFDVSIGDQCVTVKNRFVWRGK